MKIIKRTVVAFVFSIILLSGCNNDMLNNSVINESPNQGVSLNLKGMLVFQNVNVLKQELQESFMNEGNDIQKLNSNFPEFKSMKQTFDEFDKQETNLLEKLEKDLNGKKTDFNNYLMMSEMAQRYKKMILVKQYEDNQDYYYDMNINEHYWADFVTPDGLLMVNDSIYQFSKDYVKIITDGDFSKISLLESMNSSDKNNNILVFNGSDFILGNFNENDAAGCTISWNKTKTGTANNKRLELKVYFEQHPEGNYNVTTFTVGLNSLKKKVLGIWVNATANSISLHGEYSGPRSPLNINGGTGYLQSNPFDINYSSTAGIIHYKDFSPISQPCYTMTSANYRMSAVFSGGGVSTTVSW